MKFKPEVQILKSKPGVETMKRKYRNEGMEFEKFQED